MTGNKNQQAGWRPDGDEESERDKKCWIGFGGDTGMFKTLHSFKWKSLTGTTGTLLSSVTWPPIDECRWRHQQILPSVSETELEEVNGHEREQHQSNDGQIQMAAHQRRRQLLIRSSFQTDDDVQQSAQNT